MYQRGLDRRRGVDVFPRQGSRNQCVAFLPFFPYFSVLLPLLLSQKLIHLPFSFTSRSRATALITISHRPSLLKYHSTLLRLTGENGGWELSKIGTEEESLSFEQEICDLEVRSLSGSWAARTLLLAW